MFETYVINLKQDVQRYVKLEKEMKKRGILTIRYDAIYGKNIKDFTPYDKHISTYCKYFCPKSLVGCGLSHYLLLEKVYDNYRRYRNTEYTLILEDDVTPLFNNVQTIENIIIDDYPTDCDILLLFCQGICGYDNSDKRVIKNENGLIGSMAAYVIRNSSIPKFLVDPLIFHVDAQWYQNKNIITYVYNRKIFTVDNSYSYNMVVPSKNNIFYNNFDKLWKLDNLTLTEALSYKIFRFPIVGAEVTALDILKWAIVIFIIWYVFQFYKRSHIKDV